MVNSTSWIIEDVHYQEGRTYHSVSHHEYIDGYLTRLCLSQKDLTTVKCEENLPHFSREQCRDQIPYW